MASRLRAAAELGERPAEVVLGVRLVGETGRASAGGRDGAFEERQSSSQRPSCMSANARRSARRPPRRPIAPRARRHRGIAVTVWTTVVGRRATVTCESRSRAAARGRRRVAAARREGRGDPARARSSAGEQDGATSRFRVRVVPAAEPDGCAGLSQGLHEGAEDG